MAMKPTFQLRLGQQLTLTPQLQQAIRLLQLSTLELSMEIQQALESNPMLEVKEENADEQVQNTAQQEENAVPVEAQPAEQSIDLQKSDMPDELPVDSAWDDVYQPMPIPKAVAKNNDTQSFETQRGTVTTLRDHLIWQMQLTPFTEMDNAIATAIIDAVDDSGFLRESLQDIQTSLALDESTSVEVPGLDEIEAVLHRIQRFDPPGIAARDLRETLLLQLQQLPKDTPWLEQATLMINDHFDVLGQRDYPKLMRHAKLKEKPLRDVLQLIKSLNPRPGNAIASEEPHYIIPDVIVRKAGVKWNVELNQEVTPHLKINNQYARLVQRADTSPDNNFLRNHLQEARWFLKSLQSRNETLVKVAKCIVEYQKDFFEHGEEAMRPLILHDIAEAVEMHESTISRVTTQKYMYTPRGVYELKYFFSSHVSTDTGGECSSTAIRARIKKLIATENIRRPLSDSKIAELLGGQGIKVARRTIAKYREAMGVLPSNERKSWI